MQFKQLTRPITLGLLLTLALLIGGCAPRAGDVELGTPANARSTVVDLPALVIDYNQEGNPSLGGILLTELQPLIPADIAQQLTLGPTQIDFLTAANIQHIALDSRRHGPGIFVNGREFPSIAWNEESLANTGSLAPIFGGSAPVLDQILPPLTQIGAAVIVNFPVDEGKEAIPDPLNLVAGEQHPAVERQETFLETVALPPTIMIPVDYQLDGSWHVAGMTPEEWSVLTKMPWDSLRLTPQQIEAASSAGIRNVEIASDKDGLHVRVNDLDLPHLSWDQGKLNHLLAVAADAGLRDLLAANGLDAQTLLTVIDRLLPIVTAAEVSIQVVFPQADTR